jgi:hypothetical protein
MLGSGGAGSSVFIQGGEGITTSVRVPDGVMGFTLGNTGFFGGHSFHYNKKILTTTATTQVFKIYCQNPSVMIAVQFEIVISGFNTGYGAYTNKFNFTVLHLVYDPLTTVSKTQVYGYSVAAGNVDISITDLTYNEIRVSVVSPGGTNQNYGVVLTQFPHYGFNFAVEAL